VDCTRCGRPHRGDEDDAYSFHFDMLGSAGEVHSSGQAVFDDRQTSFARMGNGVFDRRRSFVGEWVMLTRFVRPLGRYWLLQAGWLHPEHEEELV
jgi:hypothetical protein